MRILVAALLMLACGGGKTTFGTGDGHATAHSYADDDAYAGEATAGDSVPPVVAEGMGRYTQQTDTFEQYERGLLDILIVVDSSGSMGGEQNKLASNLPNLLHYIKDSDWQIAVISSKLDECLEGRITKNTPNYETAYSELVNLGATGNGEYHFHKAIRGLTGNCDGNAWLRPNSSVAILIVTDQHNECFGYEDGSDGGHKLQTGDKCLSSDLATHLNSIRPRGNARVYGLLPSESKWQQHIATDPGVSSIFAARGEINAASYDTTLQEISKNVQDVLEDVFVLSQVPAGSVSVVINDATLAAARYEVDTADKLLKFNKGYLPPENAQIKVTYRYRSD